MPLRLPSELFVENCFSKFSVLIKKENGKSTAHLHFAVIIMYYISLFADFTAVSGAGWMVLPAFSLPAADCPGIASFWRKQSHQIAYCPRSSPVRDRPRLLRRNFVIHIFLKIILFVWDVRRRHHSGVGWQRPRYFASKGKEYYGSWLMEKGSRYTRPNPTTDRAHERAHDI